MVDILIFLIRSFVNFNRVRHVPYTKLHVLILIFVAAVILTYRRQHQLTNGLSKTNFFQFPAAMNREISEKNGIGNDLRH